MERILGSKHELWLREQNPVKTADEKLGRVGLSCHMCARLSVCKDAHVLKVCCLTVIEVVLVAPTRGASAVIDLSHDEAWHFTLHKHVADLWSLANARTANFRGQRTIAPRQ